MAGYGRMLYGYRVAGAQNHVRGSIEVDPVAMQVVVAVLTAPRNGVRATAYQVSRLMPGKRTKRALMSRVERIRAHIASYRLGKARPDLQPDPALAVPC